VAVSAAGSFAGTIIIASTCCRRSFGTGFTNSGIIITSAIWAIGVGIPGPTEFRSAAAACCRIVAFAVRSAYAGGVVVGVVVGVDYPLAVSVISVGRFIEFATGKYQGKS